MKRDEDFDAPALMALEADRLAHAHAARATAGLSPVALTLAFTDWAMHLAAEPIAREARRRRADLIVLGTHGRRGVRRLVLGSDAEPVVRTATVPVLLVRSAERGRMPA